MAEAEPEPEIPPPPAPDVAESRAMWKAVRDGMAAKVGHAVVNAWGTQCHLYDLGFDQWQLRLGPGISLEMFRSRFRDMLTDELCRQAQAGNQILEIVKAS